MVDESHSYPFKSLYRAMQFLEGGNPARQRHTNLFEPERGSKPAHEAFSGRHPADHYASIVAGFEHVVRSAGPHVQLAATLYWRGVRTFINEERQGRTYAREKLLADRISVNDIAKLIGRHPRTVRRWLDEFHDDLEQEFRRRKLIPPASDAQQ